MRAIVSLVLFVLVFVFGFWLSRSGKPYGAILFNVHKLIALGALVLLAVNLYRFHQVTPLNAGQFAALAVTAVCFVATMITGGLLNIEKAVMPAFVQTVHHVLPYLTVVSTGVSLYLVYGLNALVSLN